MQKNIFFTIFTILFLACSLSFLSQKAKAQVQVIERSDWGADEDILSFDPKYNFPNKIYLVLLKPTSVKSGSELMKDLYYYFSVRSGFGDFPFHYIIDRNGTIYRGNSIGDEAQIALGDAGEAIFVGYMLDDSENISLGAIGSCVDLFVTLANKYSISADNIEIKNFTFVIGERGKITAVGLADVNQDLFEAFQILKEDIRIHYSPLAIAYNIELIEKIIPQDEQEVGTTFEVKLKIKNIGENNIYSGSKGSLYLGRSDPYDAESKFYSTEWDSKSRVSILADGERFGSGEEKEFTVKMGVPLYIPEVSEKFVLIDPNNRIIEGTEFTITIKIKATDKMIIEIRETEVGYLNVRETAGVGQVIAKVTPGERYLVIEAITGYYKINVNGKEGWILSSYTRAIN